jgi:hypothetical protein
VHLKHEKHFLVFLLFSGKISNFFSKDLLLKCFEFFFFVKKILLFYKERVIYSANSVIFYFVANNFSFTKEWQNFETQIIAHTLFLVRSKKRNFHNTAIIQNFQVNIIFLSSLCLMEAILIDKGCRIEKK